MSYNKISKDLNNGETTYKAEYAGLLTKTEYQLGLQKTLDNAVTKFQQSETESESKDAMAEITATIHRLSHENRFDLIINPLLKMKSQDQVDILNSVDGTGLTLIHSAVHHANLAALQEIIFIVKHYIAPIVEPDNPQKFVADVVNRRISNARNPTLNEATPLGYMLLTPATKAEFEDVGANAKGEKVKAIMTLLIENGAKVWLGISKEDPKFANDPQKHLLQSELTGNTEQDREILLKQAAYRVGKVVDDKNETVDNPVVQERVNRYLEIAPNQEKLMREAEIKAEKINAEKINADPLLARHLQVKVAVEKIVAEQKEAEAALKNAKAQQPIAPKINLKQRAYLFFRGEPKELRNLIKQIEINVNNYNSLKKANIDNPDATKSLGDKMQTMKAELTEQNKELTKFLEQGRVSNSRAKVKDLQDQIFIINYRPPVKSLS